MGLWERLKEKEIGFSITETMRGTHEFETGCGPSGSLPFEFTVEWGTEDLTDWLSPKSGRFMVNNLAGTVRVDGLCDEASCSGTLELRYFGEHKIRYQFDFNSDGRDYRFVGEKVNIRPWNLATSHTTCFGVITELDGGRLISRSVSHFEFSSTPAFLSSLRLSMAK